MTIVVQSIIQFMPYTFMILVLGLVVDAVQRAFTRGRF